MEKAQVLYPNHLCGCQSLQLRKDAVVCCGDNRGDVEGVIGNRKGGWDTDLDFCDDDD